MHHGRAHHTKILIWTLKWTLLVGVTAASHHQRETRKFWLRPDTVLSVPAIDLQPTPNGKSPATAWRQTSAVEWAELGPGDTLCVLGIGTDPFTLPARLSGVTIDGGCTLPSSTQQSRAVWLGGRTLVLVKTGTTQPWSGPDVDGVYRTVLVSESW